MSLSNPRHSVVIKRAARGKFLCCIVGFYLLCVSFIFFRSGHTPTLAETLDTVTAVWVNSPPSSDWINYKRATEGNSQIRCEGNIRFETTPGHFLPPKSNTETTRAGIFAETRRGTCNLFHDRSSCSKFQNEESDSPDFWIQHVVSRALHGCRTKPCFAIDFGSNLGLHAMRMLQHGAFVLGVEPQADLSCASQASFRANGFADRANFVIGGISHIPTNEKLTSTDQYRYGGTINVTSLYSKLGVELPTSVPIYALRDILPLNAGLKNYKFVKIDTDSLDCDLVREFLNLKDEKLLTFQSASFETWAGPGCADPSFSELLERLQKDGYNIYRARNDARDDFEDLTELAVTPAPGITLFMFGSMNLDEWLAIPKEWAGQYQMFISNIEPRELGTVQSREEFRDQGLRKEQHCRSVTMRYDLNGVRCKQLIRATHGTGRTLGDASPEDCAAECCSRPLCSAWQYKQNQGCWLGSDADKVIVVDRSECESGYGWYGSTISP
jgi:hypothetical protein